MSEFRPISSLALALAFAAGVCAAPAQEFRGQNSHAQESAYAQFRAHNASMTEVQPSWMGPLTHTDARLGQGMKLSVSNSSYPPGHPIVYGNNHGVSMIVERRFQVDFNPPSFFRNHASAEPDGFGNAGTQMKWRIASGNAEHGNYAVSAVLYHGFGARSVQNGFLSAYYVPSIAAGKSFGRVAVVSTVGGILPTANIWDQGRAVEWNLTGQAHLSAHLWFDVENNAAFFHGGPDDGRTQNFMTPVAFYMIRRKSWKPEHAAVVFDSGMQIATSTLHVYNHNLITEMRVVF